jgi:Ca2+-binding RTX toxin-like protein
MHQLVYLLANLAVGGAGSWPGVADPSAFPAAMTVDYIRVYLNDVTTLYGTSGPDLLAGGAGANTLIGRTGDDSYLVDNVGDGVIENAGEGTDTFFSTVHVRLSANFEHLVLQGSADLQGYGNASADTLR